MEVIELTDATFDAQVTNGTDRLVMVHFYATWCGPCRMIEPIVARLFTEMGERMMVGRLDVEANPSMPARFGIRSLPTLLYFSAGELRDQVIGAVPYVALHEKAKTLLIEEHLRPKEEEELLALVAVDDKIRMVTLLPDGTYKYLDGSSYYHNILYVYGVESVALKAAVEEFEDLINTPSVREQDLHEFFERHPRFILNDDYKQAHSKIVLEREDGGPLIPDFLLEPFGTPGLCDLLELKLPTANAYVLKKNRMRFSAAVFEAAAQLREYSRYFEESAYRSRLKEQYGLEAYKPKMFVILGKTGKVNPLDVRNMELDLPGITFRSYDSILERMRAKLAR